MTTAPSPSATITSFGNTATPPQPIGSCQPTKVSPATEGGAAVPWHHTGRPVPSTPARSRTTPSVTSAATPRLLMRAQRMSPKMPASVTPIASTTAMQPAGIASIAARVEIGEAHEAGVARSSRAGTKRSVKARPTRRRGRGARQRPRAAHPDVAQALLQQHRGEGRGGHRFERGERSRQPGEADRWRSCGSGVDGRRERDCARARVRAPAARG